MKVLLTGATGFIGSAVLRAAIAHGHDVIAPVRSAASADAVGAAGAIAVQGDLTDTRWLVEHLASVDAAIHTASPGDATSADIDAAVADSAIAAFSGSARRYLHTSGIWLWGSGSQLTEASPLEPPSLVSWRIPIEDRLLDSAVSVSIPAPGVVTGAGRGITGLLRPAPDAESVSLVGDGSQHWSLVHVGDLADFYLALLHRDTAVGRVHAVSGTSPTVREIAETQAAGAEVIAESAPDAADRLGAQFAEALLLDQQASGSAARALGWQPKRTTLDDLLLN